MSQFPTLKNPHLKTTPLEFNIKLELLFYPNPKGIHPVEEGWRDFARDLLTNYLFAYFAHHGPNCSFQTAYEDLKTQHAALFTKLPKAAADSQSNPPPT